MAAIKYMITKKNTTPSQWLTSSFPQTPVQQTGLPQVTQECECLLSG